MPEGIEIKSGLTGTVTTAPYNDSYGNYVILQDNRGYELWYAHLQSICVAEGASVTKGDLIGLAGKEGFDFLGMHYRRMTTETSKGQLYKETYQYPSRKAMKKMKVEIKRNVNNRCMLVAKEEDLIKNLNPKITGWKNYYSTKTNEKWMLALDWYVICTFTRWYNKKH